MKKKIAIIILILISIIGLIYKQHLNKEKDTNKEMVAIFLEEEKGTGKYHKSKLKNWSVGDEYVINIQKSYCKNGGLLRWNQETKKISAKIKGSDECYVYFDKDEYGTKEHPYLIQTIEDLVRLSNSVNDGTTYAGKYFLLTNDLDFTDKSDYEDANRTDFGNINGQNGNEALITELTTGSGFKPIGNSQTNSFQGTFNGNNKQIEGLYINNTNINANIGFLGYGVNVSIVNLTIKGQIINAVPNINVGGFIGYAWGNNTFQNLNNYVDIKGENLTFTTSDSLNNYGGIVGLNYNYGNTLINNCHNFSNIIGPWVIGGLVGGNIFNDLIIENCSNRGNISNSSTNSIVGGIIGRNIRSNSIINKCFNTGNVKSANYGSGIIGTVFSEVADQNQYNYYILNTYNLGNVESTNSAHGILLIQHGKLFIYNTFNNGKIIAPDNKSKGLIFSFSDEIVRMNNVYNSSDENYALGIFGLPSESKVTNAYYLKKDNILGSNANFGTAITVDQMKQQTFVDELNNNIASIDLGEEDAKLKNYSLSKWQIGSNGYPTLINE